MSTLEFSPYTELEDAQIMAGSGLAYLQITSSKLTKPEMLLSIKEDGSFIACLTPAWAARCIT